MQHSWLFLGTIFFLFVMNIFLLARDKTKKYLPISHRIIHCQTYLACIIRYQLMQGWCPHSDNPLEKGLRKRASVQNKSPLVNYKIVLDWNTQYCMQKASFWCLFPSCWLYLSPRSPTEILLLVIWWNNISAVHLRRN